MIREYLAHFEYTGLAIAGQLLFMAVFVAVLFRALRQDFSRASKIPFEEEP
ncbi:MAG: hypothetical protein HUU37_04070 [Bdellovibrionales bacterium]|nr:hypothetical protein [Bdellovibrionales bacterium]